jgi:fructokinase
LPDVLCLGEALIDFVADTAGVTLMEAPGFRKAPGGAPANVACGVARLGTSSAFLGKVGDDPFGRFLEATFRAAGVDTTPMLFDKTAKAGLAFVSLTAEGDREFSFWRNPSADMLLTAGELPVEMLRAAKALHYGSITLIQEPSRGATFEAVRLAHEAGATISYDPNLRLSLWPSASAARAGMLEGMPHADFVKVAEEELEFLFGSTDAGEGVAKIVAMGAKLVGVTRGPEGALLSDGTHTVEHGGYRVDTVDTTGAGDGFVAAVLDHIVRRGGILGFTCDELTELVRFANAVGALTTTVKGAIPGLPNRERSQALARS